MRALPDGTWTVAELCVPDTVLPSHSKWSIYLSVCLSPCHTTTSLFFTLSLGSLKQETIYQCLAIDERQLSLSCWRTMMTTLCKLHAIRLSRFHRQSIIFFIHILNNGRLALLQSYLGAPKIGKIIVHWPQFCIYFQCFQIHGHNLYFSLLFWKKLLGHGWCHTWCGHKTALYSFSY